MINLSHGQKKKKEKGKIFKSGGRVGWIYPSRVERKREEWISSLDLEFSTVPESGGLRYRTVAATVILLS